MPVELPPMPEFAPPEIEGRERRRSEGQSGLGALVPGEVLEAPATSRDEPADLSPPPPVKLRADLDGLVGQVENIRRTVQNIGATAVSQAIVEQQAQQLQEIQKACLEYRNAILLLQQHVKALAQQQQAAGWAFLALKTAAETRGPGDPPNSVMAHAKMYFEFLKEHAALPAPPAVPQTQASEGATGGDSLQEGVIVLSSKPETKH